ncbi:vitamin K epoxide reductase family protein [Patescibacteria group bacterium]
MNKKVRKILYIVTFFFLVNIGFSVYLAYEFYYPDESSVCSINAIFDCISVAKSGYAVLFGIPIAILGVLFYVGLFALTVALLAGFPFNKIHKKFTKSLVYMALRFLVYFGVLFSLALTYIEAFVIHVYCPFCVAQQIIIIIVAGLLISAKKAMQRG